MRRHRLVIAAAALAVFGSALHLASAAGDGLPHVASGHRPGPDALYLPPADAPQLQNTGPWVADPILVSGATEYAQGEFLYQDFLYDDHGAAGVPDTNAPIGPNAFLFSPTAGTYTYPTDASRYAYNAADLVELRVKPLTDSTAFRVTMNTLLDAEDVAFTVALGGTPGAGVAWPHGANVSSPASLFLTVHGTTAELADVSGLALAPAPTVTVDATRRQFDVRVPHAAWNPGSSTVRMTIGTGLWANGAYLAPAIGNATATTPGGASPVSDAAIVNVGPRTDEPYPALNDPAAPWTLGDSAAGAAYQARWWRERSQADALRLGDVGAFAAQVDFAKLAAATFDDSGVPKTGPLNRILASHYAFGQGFDPNNVCFDIGSQFNAGAACKGRLTGRLQAYALYVPGKPEPANGWGLTLQLHSLSANYNQYSASRNQSELGDRGDGSIVLTPGGRGPDGFYAGYAEADTFETWADVARHYALNPDWTVVTGYSMGGFGTYRLLARYPDLFARGFSTVGIPGANIDPQVASLRNTPVLAWNDVGDELVRIDQSEAAEQELAAAGLRFVEWLFLASDHLTLATNDEYGPAAEWLGTHTVDRNPAHVTYVVQPAEDSAGAASVADHAYWLAGVTSRDGGIGTIDVRSEGFGQGDPAPSGVAEGAGALMGGSHGPMPFVSREQDWGPVPSTAAAGVLDVAATNVSAVTIDPARANVGCDATLNVTTDGPLAITLAGCGPAQTFG